MKTPHVTHWQASHLLHNKFVVVLGDSIQRGVYKDLVLLLQKDNYMSLSQLKTKGEEVFENDDLIEGGRRGHMTNGTEYKESIFEDFENGLKPDVVIVNSCVWDVSRYGRRWEADYLENLTVFFRKLRTILPDEALVIWNLTMPLGKTIIGGFLVPEIAALGPSLRFDIIKANYCSATLASVYGLDVLDLHFQFRFSLQYRMRDGVHWNAVAHRRITCLLLTHIANAWGVELPPFRPPAGLNLSFSEQDPATKEIHPQRRESQNSGTSWRPKKRWTNYYPPSATSWMTHYRYTVPGHHDQWMDPCHVRGNKNQWMEPPHAQGPVGFNTHRKRYMDQYSYRGPQFRETYFTGGQDFSRDYILPQAEQSHNQGFFVGDPPFQSDGDNYGYVMRKKYSRHAQYRPY